jgi:hypothetical protein
MAKRRNQKKEKALRNQAYARKFRKKTGGRMNNRGRRSFGGGQSNDEQEGAMDQGAESTGAAD